MQILSVAGKYGNQWVVLAEWHGETRVVKSGSVWDCLLFVKDHS